jgi:hypothetical protein
MDDVRLCHRHLQKNSKMMDGEEKNGESNESIRAFVWKQELKLLMEV